MKKYLILFALILIQGCSSGGGDGSAGTVTNSIVGIWEYTYPASGCVETYTIYPTGTWSQTSLDENTSGSYVFEDTVNVGERHAFSVDIVYDNGLPDCNGNSEIDTGLSLTLYVSFPSSTVMEWYTAETGGVAEATLTWIAGPFDPTPTDPNTEFQLFPTGAFTAGYGETTSFTGSDTAGGAYTATLSEQTQAESTFLGVPAIPVLRQFQMNNTTTGAFVTVLGTEYYTTSATDRRYLGYSGDTTTVSSTTTAVPQTAKIGDFGVVGTYTDNTGDIDTQSWRLDDAGGGYANAVRLSAETDQFGNPTKSSVRTATIDVNGYRLSRSLVLHYHDINITVTLNSI